MNILGDNPGKTGPPVPSLDERESTLAAWVSRAQGSMKGAQECRFQGDEHVGLTFWAFQQSGFGNGGNADLFIQSPPDGAHNDGWREVVWIQVWRSLVRCGRECVKVNQP